MAYPISNPYQSYFQQFPTYQAQPAQQMAAHMEIIRVHGKGGVDAFPMAPNSSVLLLDETAPIVWMKTTDGAGYATETPYSIALYQPEQEIDTRTLDQRIKRLEDVINEYQSNAGSSKHKSSSAEEPNAE